MVLRWCLASLIPVGSVLTTPMLDVRPTTVVDAMHSTMMRAAIMSLDNVALLPHVRTCTQSCMACAEPVESWGREGGEEKKLPK